MINSNLATIFVLVLLGLVACFGYYKGFLTLVTQRVNLSSERVIQGKIALLFGFIFLVGAIVASAIATFYYFSMS